MIGDYWSVDQDEIEWSNADIADWLKYPRIKMDHPTPQHKVDIIQPLAQGASDPIRPSHYDLGLGHGLEVMDLIRANADGLTGFQGFAFGNILKYVLRFRRKNGLEDLLKARTYLDQLIQSLQDASVDPNTTRHSDPAHKTPQRPSQEASAL